MSFEINERFITDLKINDEMFYESLISELEDLIENELSKQDDEIDVAFIDECCVAVENLRAAQMGEEVIPYETIIDIESMIKLQSRRKRIIYISSVACAAVAVVCTVFSLRFADANKQSNLRPYESPGDLSGKTETNGSNNNIEGSVTTPFSQTTENITIVEPISTTDQIVTDVIMPPDITQPVPTIYRLDILVKPGTCLRFEDESLIELSDVDVVVSYSDNSTETVPIEECQVDIGTADENGKVKVTVTYKYMSADIYVEIETIEE